MLRPWGPFPWNLFNPCSDAPSSPVVLMTTSWQVRSTTLQKMLDTLGEFIAFFSYAHIDDEYDEGRITGLRRRLEQEMHMKTGKVFPIFQDRRDISLGQQWRDRIENSITGSTLLIAVITPSFLQSKSCREEVRLFMTLERRFNRSDLIMPIDYIPLPSDVDIQDDLAKEIRSRQAYPWGQSTFQRNGFK